MEQKILDQTTMIQYLLGLLSEDDSSRLEESFFKDDEYFEELVALEDDLIDDYVNDWLPDSFRIAFEEKLKSDAGWKQRVVVAGALSRRAVKLQPRSPESVSSPSFWELVAAAFRSRQPAYRLALLAGAAAVLVVFGVSAWQVIEQRRDLETFQAERRNSDTTIRNIQTELAQLQARGEDLNRQLEAERLGRQELEKAPAKNVAPAGLIASFVLRAGSVRGSDESMRLIIPKSVQSVRLQLDLATVGDYRSYQAALRTAAGAVVWAADMVRTTATASGKTVVIDLPPQFLAPGNYELGLLGLVDRGRFEEVAYYNFTVQEK